MDHQGDIQAMVSSGESQLPIPTVESASTVCPYLDTIQRTVLDFDFEASCSVTIQSGPHIYACLVCGRYFRGRGPHTPAYTHAVDASHFVFLHLTQRKFYCLPDNYEIKNDPSLQDIRDALHPTFTASDIQKLDNNTDLSRDLFGRLYLPGFVGLNNLYKTDGINSVVQALAHVRPLRNFFLEFPSSDETYQQAREPSSTTGTLSSTPLSATHVTHCFAALVRQLWSSHRFKSQVDPHKLVHAITVASNNKYRIGHQLEIGEFIAWFLHQLHLGTGGSEKNDGHTASLPKRKKGNASVDTPNDTPINKKQSIIQQIFQGVVRVKTRQAKRKVDVVKENDTMADDRAGSDDDDEAHRTTGNKIEPITDTANQKIVKETVADLPFLQLTLDLSEKPLFRDQDGGLVIPQEHMVTVLQKFDGVTASDSFGRQKTKKNGLVMIPQRKTYQLLQLPDVLILHLARFPNRRAKQQNVAKNPTIVVFPVKNMDLTNYVASSPTLPSDSCESYRYDLVANIVHDSPADVGREGTAHDPLQEGSYKCHVQHRAGQKQQWYEIQDLHVQEIMPQQIGVSESYLLILERTKTSI